MAYATAQEIIDRVGIKLAAELTNDGDDSVTPVTATLTTHAGEASSVVDAYLSVRYQTPVVLTGLGPDVAALLRRLTVDIAVHGLQARRQDIPESTQAVYDAAIAFLKDVQAARASLPIPATAIIPERTANPSAAVRMSSDERTCTMASLAGL